MNGRRLLPGKPIPLSEIPDYSIERDTLDEVFADRFRLRLKRIADLVKQSGERLEGNIFYPDLEDRFVEQPPDVALAPGPPQCLARRAVQGAPARSRRQRGP